ncbi:MAG: hypothetical protein KF767_05600 [Bdellovibrionaceae bacterium]|nr:hypothetical protein [Pseudobdellovibrionaceae bacterium]
MELSQGKTTTKLAAISGSLFLLLLTACAPGFRLQDAAGNDIVNLDAVKQPAASLKTVDGEVKWNPSSEALPSSLDFEVKIPYGRVFGMSSKIVKGVLPFSCQLIPGITNSSYKSYEKGEIPCGGIIDGNWKQLLMVNVDAMSGKSDGFDYRVGAVNFPVWLSRDQRAGDYNESDLDTKSSVTRRSSKHFGEDVSLRFNPSGSKAAIELCLNVPGSTVTSNRQTVWSKASKKILGIKLSYDSDFDINPGQARFDYARGCFQIDLGYTGLTSAPTVALKTTKNPALANASYAGLNIKIKDWFLRLIDNVMNFFKSSIRKKVQAQVVRSVNDMLDQDVETGRWFTKIHGEELVREQGEKLTRDITKAVNRIGLPASVADLKAQLKDRCRLKKLSVSPDWDQRLEEFCTRVIDQVEIEVEAFARDEAMAAKGCYSHLARLHDSNGKWWASECQFVSRFRVKLPTIDVDYLTELKLLVANLVAMDRIPDDWRAALDDLNLDEATLGLVLEELEKRGFNQVNRGDLETAVEEILKRLRTAGL